MNTKNKKPILVIGIVVTFILILFLQSGKNESDTPDSNTTIEPKTQEVVTDTNAIEDNSIKALLELIASESGGTIVSEAPTDISWTTSGPGLGLTDGRIITLEETDFDKVENYLIENGWGTEDMFWAYKTDIPNEVGYLTKKMTHPFAGAMCILNRDDSTIKCGYGPSGAK